VANETSLARTVWRDASQDTTRSFFWDLRGARIPSGGVEETPKSERVEAQNGVTDVVVKDQMLLPISGFGVE
jgi:hypothetical protein